MYIHVLYVYSVTETGIGNVRAICIVPESLLRPHPLNICVSDCMFSLFSCFTYMFTVIKLFINVDKMYV